MAAIRIKQIFKNLNIPSGDSVESERINLVELRPDGNFSFQYTKNAGGGKLKVDMKVSNNGVDFDDDPSGFPVVQETVVAENGWGQPHPPVCGYVKFVATAVDADITNLNGWTAIQ